MATTVPNNPFDTQQPAAAPAPAPAAAPAPAPAPGIVGGAMPSPYNAVTRSVQPNQTVQGQVDSILSSDGPLMQRARANALEQANARGLINSSMAVQAAQGAVMDRALPIAQQDANTYNQVASENAGYTNRAGEFNAGESNRFGLQQNDQAFTGSQNQANRDFTAQQQQAAQKFQTSERIGSQDFSAQQQTAQNEQQLKVLMQQNENTLATLGYQNKLAMANVPLNFAASVSSSTADRINQIMADPNLTPDAKKAAADNVVNYANATMAWAEKFYNVPMTNLAVPGTPTAAPQAPVMGQQPTSPASGGSTANTIPFPWMNGNNR